MYCLQVVEMTSSNELLNQNEYDDIANLISIMKIILHTLRMWKFVGGDTEEDKFCKSILRYQAYTMYNKYNIFIYNVLYKYYDFISNIVITYLRGGNKRIERIEINQI